MNEWLLKGGLQPEERAGLLLSPLFLVALLAFGIEGLIASLFFVPALAMAWSDYAQTKAGIPWSPCSCRNEDPYKMMPVMSRRRYKTAGVLIIVGTVLALLLSTPVIAVPFVWSGLATAAAVRLRYGGCPELGLLASMMRGKLSRSGCGPWCDADRRSGDLSPKKSAA